MTDARTQERGTYLVARDIGLHPGIPLKVATHIDRKDKEHATLLPEGLVELLLIVFLQTNSETQGELRNFHIQRSLTKSCYPLCQQLVCMSCSSCHAMVNQHVAMGIA